MNRLFFITVIIFFISLLSCKSGASSGDIDQKDSIAYFTNIIEEDPDNPAPYLSRAALYKAKNMYNEAIIDVQKAIQLDNKNYDNYLVLADLFLTTNQVQGTIHSLNAVLVNEPNHVEANLKMAELNLMFKRYNEAINSSNNVLKADPYNSRAHFIKGYTFKESGDTLKAVDSFMEAVKQNPEFYSAYVELGILFSAKHDPIAVQYFQNAINADPSRTDSYYNLGLFYQNHDMLNEAQDAYRKLNEIDPNFPYSYFNIGYILLEISGVPEEAAPYFAKAIKYKPDYYEAHYNLGLCLERIGNLQDAIESYKNALKYNTNYPKAIEALNRVDEIMMRK